MTDVTTKNLGGARLAHPVLARTARFFPETRALRILFYPEGMKAAYLLFWGVTAGIFLVLMTYRSLKPLDVMDVVVSVGFGALMPLSLLLGFRANRFARECHLHKMGGSTTGPAMAVSVLATVSSCMCCLPVLPILLGFFLAGTAFAPHIGVMVGTVAVWAPWFYLPAGILLFGSIDRNSRSLVGMVDAVDPVRPSGVPGDGP